MRLTPLDIRKQEFGRSLRGLNPDEVGSFLQMVSNQWDELLSDQRQLEQRVRELETKLEHYSNVEEALQEALRTARESSKQALESARQQALGIIREAERRSDEMKRSAEQERIGLRREANDALMRRNEIAARLRAFLQSELELLARFEADFPGQKAASDSTTRSEDFLDERTEIGNAPEPEKHEPAGQAEFASLRDANVLEPAEFDEAGQAWESPVDASLQDRQVTEDAPVGRPDKNTVDHSVVREESRGGASFVVRPVFVGASSPKNTPAMPEEKPDEVPAEESRDSYNISASADEIERIRRILKDLE